MANNTASVDTTPGYEPSVVPKERERIFVLHFRHQNQVKQKNFNFRGVLKDAIVRGREHCDKMGYRFVLVRPFVVDLEHQEHLKNSDPERFEEGY